MQRLFPTMATLVLLGANANPIDDQAVIRDYFAQYSTSSDRANLRQMAFCIADRYPAQARSAIREQATTTILKKKYPNLLDTSCLKGALFKGKQATILDGYYQQLMAERLLLVDFKRGDLPDVSQASPLIHPSLPIIDREKIPEQFLPLFELNWALKRFDLAAECVSRSSPKLIFALVEAKPDSEQERAAFNELQDPIKSCGRGEPVSDIPIFVWRGMIAENLYRLADSVRPSAPDVRKSDA